MILVVLGVLEELYLEPECVGGNLNSLVGSPVSVFYNPSYLREGYVFTTTYSLPFLIQNTSFSQLTLSIRKWVLGLNHLILGSYRETSLGIGFTGDFSQNTTMGISFIPFETQFGDVSKRGLLAILGTFSKIPSNPKFELAFRYKFGLYPRWARENFYNILGLSITLGENPSILIDLDFTELQNPESRFSVRYRFIRWFSLGLGFSSLIPQISLSLFFETNPSFSLLLRYHHYLGLTPSFNLKYNLGD